MSIDNFYDDIDAILQDMYDYHGIDRESDGFFDDFDDDNDDDDFIDFSCGRSEIEQCGLILEKYVDDLFALSSEELNDGAIMKTVERAVKSINKLNEKCDYELAESSISDDICEFMHKAALAAGLEDAPDNVADEWREF